MLFSSAAFAVLTVDDTYQVQNTKDDVIVKQSMNARLQASELSSGDVNPTGVYKDATGSTASSATSTIMISKIASAGGVCQKGQLSTDAIGKLLSCESGVWALPPSGLKEGTGWNQLLTAFEGKTVSCVIEPGDYGSRTASARVINGRVQTRIDSGAWVDGSTILSRGTWETYSASASFTGLTGGFDGYSLDSGSYSSFCFTPWPQF